jgi:hypothetical protein
MNRQTQRALGKLALGCMLCTLPADAAAPVVHEWFDPNPEEDLRYDATTIDGTMPAALQTQSGIVPAPSNFRRPYAMQSAYGGDSTPDSMDATYRIDRDTTRPNVVGYDDPFSPSVAPFKRTFAYDAVNEALELVVRDKGLKPLYVGNTVDIGEDEFFGDLFVDLAENVAVRIPTVGPGAKLLAMRVEPKVDVKFFHDGADNWFIRGVERKRVRLIMQLSIRRDVFGSQFARVPYADLADQVPPLPAVVRPHAQKVLAQIGVSRATPPNEVVTRLVDYFRGFAPSDERPTSASGVLLYEELARTRKGVCRHRAYAFVLTALEAGIPARLVRNEAHAWVEVYDTTLWHRIDLGGAAGRMDFQQEQAAQAHRLPSDPYRWPENASNESGSQMAERALASSVFPSPGGNSRIRPGSPNAASSAGVASPAASASAGVDAPGNTASGEDERAASELTLQIDEREALRGAPVTVRGTVNADGNPCRFGRVDIWLRSSGGERVAIGALPTDENGQYVGMLTIPYNADVGDYRVFASTPGIGHCGSGESR